MDIQGSLMHHWIFLFHKIHHHCLDILIQRWQYYQLRQGNPIAVASLGVAFLEEATVRHPSGGTPISTVANLAMENLALASLTVATSSVYGNP
jgi:hypothetical protein